MFYACPFIIITLKYSNEVYIVQGIAYVKDSGTLRISKRQEDSRNDNNSAFEPVDLFKLTMSTLIS
nr:BPK_HP1_G0058360.mRNA.1.CDS.1 [Saccharomyces cerevisiae]